MEKCNAFRQCLLFYFCPQLSENQSRCEHPPYPANRVLSNTFSIFPESLIHPFQTQE